MREEGIDFWQHRGFWRDLQSLSRDGVHLDDRTSNGRVVSSDAHILEECPLSNPSL